MIMEILTNNQRVLLIKIGLEKTIRHNFYLTGGTALAVFYLQHRYSDDLDFFSETEFTPDGIRVFFEKIKPAISLGKIDYQQNLNRNLFFLHFSEEIIKAEFTFFPFPRIETGRQELGVCSISRSTNYSPFTSGRRLEIMLICISSAGNISWPSPI